MSYIRNLGETIQRQVPLWATSHVVPRGLLIPLDPWLNGTARAAKKVGDTLPVLVPNNTATIANQLQTQDITLTLNDNTLTYLNRGFLISLNGIAIAEVAGRTGNVLTLTKKAGVSLAAGTRISVFAFPVTVHGEVLVPEPPLPRPDIFVFKSSVEVIQGDYLDIPITDSQGKVSYNEYEIVEILAARKSALPDDAAAPLIWQVRISQVTPADVPEEAKASLTTLEGIPRDLRDNETIYLRAFPAYVSKPFIVDPSYFNVPTAEIGPYILDRVSGLVIDNPESEPPTEDNPAGEGQVDVDEVCEISLLHSDLRVWEVNRLKVREQLPVWNPTIESEHVVMWNPIRGSLEFEAGFVDLVLDKYGFAELETTIVPEINLSAQHVPSFTVISQSDRAYEIAIEFYPNKSLTHIGTPAKNSGGTLWTDSMTLSLDPDGTAPRAVKLSAVGLPGQRVKVHSISSSLPRITNIRYKILARTVGDYHWASSGLMQKPMFLSAYLTEGIGVQVPLDRGKIMFPGRKKLPPAPTTSSSCSGTNPAPTAGVGFRTLWSLNEFQLHVDLPIGSATGYSVDWGDGSAIELNGLSHDYATDGDYIIEIRGNCPQWSFQRFAPGSAHLITQVLTWGNSDMFYGFNDLEGGFYQCYSLTTLPAMESIPALGSGCPNFDSTFANSGITSIPPDLFTQHTNVTSFTNTFSQLTITSIPAGLFRYNTRATSFAYTFFSCANVVSLPAGLFDHNVLATDFNSTFYYCATLTTIPAHLFDFNVRATNFSQTFASCYNLVSIAPNLFDYNIRAETFNYTFSTCQSLASIPDHLFDFNVAATDFSGTFYECRSLTAIPAHLFDHNSLATTFAATFDGCLALTAIPPNLFDFNVEAVSFSSTFRRCRNVVAIPPNLFDFNVEALYFGDTFGGCRIITSIPAHLFDFNTKAIDFSGCFDTCEALAAIPPGLFDFNVLAVDFGYTFSGCKSVAAIPPGLFDFNVLATEFTSTFNDCETITAIPAGLFDHCPGVTSFWSTFSSCFSLTSVPVGLFDNNLLAEDFSYTFFNSVSLSSIPADLFHNNSAVTSFESTFGFSGLTSIPATLFSGNPNVQSFMGVFRDSWQFNSIPAGLFANCTQVRNFAGAFGVCLGLTSIPAGLFDNNPLVQDFSSVFGGCENLSAIPAGLFDHNPNVEKFGSHEWNDWFPPYWYAGAFYGTAITSIPAGLFANNPKVRDYSKVFANCRNLTTVPNELFPRTTPYWGADPTIFVFYQSVFEDCPNLSVNPSTFYIDGVGEATRFVDLVADFSSCFNRAGFTGVQGKAPDLWACEGTLGPYQCFAGAGNSLASLSNYASIPNNWK